MDFQENFKNFDWESVNMEAIQNFVVLNGTKVDFAWTVFIYAPLVLRQAFTRYFTPAGSKVANYQGFPWIPLVIHMILGLTLIFRYQFRAVTSIAAPEPKTFDIVLGITNSLISWRLCMYEARGNPKLVRVAFQVMALMVFFPAVMCYYTSSPMWYHSMVKMHNTFVYVRWFLIGGGALGVFSSFHELYTISVFAGGLLGMMDGKYFGDSVLGVPLGLALHVGLVVLERWTSSLVTHENSKSSPFIWLLLMSGLVEVETYKILKEPVAEEVPPPEKVEEAVKA